MASSSGDRFIDVLLWVEHMVMKVVALALLVAALGLLGWIAVYLVTSSHEGWADRYIDFFEGLLLVVIVIEAYRTVVEHVSGGGLAVEPFLIIGVIAVIRHILALGVKGIASSGGTAQTPEQLWDLGVNAGVAFLLVSGLALYRWSKPATRSPREP